MTQQRIPNKRYFKIGEVSKLADVASHVLRYWESEFDDIKPKRANSGQRLYRHEDVELILTIKDLLHHQGYTIAGARKLLENQQPKGDKTLETSSRTKDPNQLTAIKKELLELKRILAPGDQKP